MEAPNASLFGSFVLDIFELRDAQNRRYPVGRAEYAQLCIKLVNKSLFGYLVWVSVKSELSKKFVSGMARQTCIPLHQKSQPRCFWILRMCTFEILNTQKSVFLL